MFDVRIAPSADGKWVATVELSPDAQLINKRGTREHDFQTWSPEYVTTHPTRHLNGKTFEAVARTVAKFIADEQRVQIERGFIAVFDDQRPTVALRVAAP